MTDECPICKDDEEPCAKCRRQIHESWHAIGCWWIRPEECHPGCPGYKPTVDLGPQRMPATEPRLLAQRHAFHCLGNRTRGVGCRDPYRVRRGSINQAQSALPLRLFECGGSGNGRVGHLGSKIGCLAHVRGYAVRGNAAIGIEEDMAVIRIVTTKGEEWCYDNNERIVARERRSRRPEWCYARPINDVSIGMWFYANSNSATSDPNGARYWISKR